MPEKITADDPEDGGISKNNGLVSVVIPVYNGRAFILETLASIEGQTYKDIEIIVVDDGSDDGTVGLLKDYVNQSKTDIKIMRNSDIKGAAGARNTGIEAARGGYIAFIDADDMWHPEKLERQTAFIRKKDAAFSFTAYEYADEQCRGMGKVVWVPESIDYKHALRNTTIFTSTVVFDMGKLSKDDIYFPYIESEDSANWWKVLKKTGNAYGLNEPLTLYRRSKKTLSSNKLLAVKRVWGLYRNEGLSIPQSLYCFAGYAFNAVKRRL